MSTITNCTKLSQQLEAVSSHARNDWQNTYCEDIIPIVLLLTQSIGLQIFSAISQKRRNSTTPVFPCLLGLKWSCNLKQTGLVTVLISSRLPVPLLSLSFLGVLCTKHKIHNTIFIQISDICKSKKRSSFWD